MNNKNYIIGILIGLILTYSLFLGCDKMTSKPQFVAVAMSRQDGTVNVQPLFAFDIHTDGSCRVTYMDTYGRVLASVDGRGLPSDVVNRYKGRLANRRCSGDATIYVSENGRILLSQDELADVAAITSAAPPDEQVSEKLHPTTLSILHRPRNGYEIRTSED